MKADFRTIQLAGSPVNLLMLPEALDFIGSRAGTHAERPLAVASINLDHVHYFGAGSQWSGELEHDSSCVDWLNLIDGAPVVAAAHRHTGEWWPRLAGSDLIEPILERAVAEGLSVGFFGGMPETHAQLRGQLARSYPGLRIAGYWAPSRSELDDPARCTELAGSVAKAHTDILVVSLGKPRQELWISRYGATTNAGVLLAFGAVVDFLAGRVVRAPRLVARVGMEWAWRLMLEPRRLAHRYLVDGPGAYRALRRSSRPAIGDSEPR
jgi:exopolysaccharide biosynthesis WecB/TagA/CpsF family protein